MRFTGTRATTYEGLKAVRRTIGRDAYAASIKDLERLEKKARQQAAKREKEREARELAKLQAELKEIAKKEAEREAAREAARVARNAKKRAARAAAKAAKKLYSVHIQTKSTVHRQKEDGTPYDPFELTHDDYFEAYGSEIQTKTEKVYGEWISYLTTESGLTVVSSEWVEVSRLEVSTSSTATANVLMQQTGSLFLDGEEKHEFDTGNNTCVFDWIIHHYGDIRGCKKTATRAGLVEILGEEALIKGVSAVMLDAVCDALGCCQYALDETNEIIHAYSPEEKRKINNNVPPLVYRVKNGHFYPIVKEAKSICQMGRITNQSQKGAAKDEKEVKQLEIVILEDTEEDKNRFEQVVRICKEHNVEVYGRSMAPLHYSEDGLVGFELEGKLYRWESDEMIEASRKIYEMNGQEYDGSTIPGMILKQMAFRGDMSAKSQLNPHTSSVLSKAKNRIHYGRLASKRHDEWAADIIKCYSSCLMDPMEKFYIFDVNDEWTAWDRTYEHGLYFVETEDMRLFHGSNVYSLAMIERALKAEIQFTITSQLRPSKLLPTNYFNQMVIDIKSLCHDDISLMKLFFNIFVGMLGKSKHTTVNGRMDTDANTVWREYNADKPGKPFITKSDNYYFFGREITQDLAEHNLPIWLQILDWSNIKLFDLISSVEATGGRLVGRKTDCAVFVGGSLVEKLEVGGHRLCDVPLKMKEMASAEYRSLASSICEHDDWMTAPITSSNAVADAVALLKHGGMLITGFAGTGKTYLAKKIAEQFEGAVLRMAPTNKAALNIGGRTIHKELKIDMSGKFNLKGLRKLYARQRILIFIDEGSMVGSDLWRKLVELKKALPLSVWVILGDEGQCRPVGEEHIDFFQSSMVRYLAAGIRINLTEIQRYDLELAELALAIRTGQPFEKKRGQIMSGRHLCYYNKTRMWLNGLLNEKRGIFVPCEDPEPGSQNAWLYPGCPLIAVRNFSKRDQMFCVNSEQFVIRSVTDSDLVVVSQRPEGEHVWELKTADFHRWFHLNFASTVHKSQGDTLTGSITIWDHDAMTARILYTAVTRAKSLNQILFA